MSGGDVWEQLEAAHAHLREVMADVDRDLRGLESPLVEEWTITSARARLLDAHEGKLACLQLLEEVRECAGDGAYREPARPEGPRLTLVHGGGEG